MVVRTNVAKWLKFTTDIELDERGDDNTDKIESYLLKLSFDHATALVAELFQDLECHSYVETIEDQAHMDIGVLSSCT